jgi:hypothetical protein
MSEEDEDHIPDLVIGDTVLLEDINENMQYEGLIHFYRVWDTEDQTNVELQLRMSETFSFSMQHYGAFRLRLKLCRLPIRRALHALVTPVENLSRLLFPVPANVKFSGDLLRAEIGDLPFAPFEPLVGADDQQATAVLSILHQPPAGVPFVIDGP